MFQSTHPRGVRRHDDPGFLALPEVSIHAPAWGATLLTNCGHAGLHVVSIHAPAWGATRTGSLRRSLRPVSIHAPAWGATTPSTSSLSPYPCFNPRTRVGCDVRVTVTASRCVILFQSTHPRGVRRVPAGLIALYDGFNPRTRVGCDVSLQSKKDALEAVSIHAPAWGATPRKLPTTDAKPCFNPRTRVGCDAPCSLRFVARSRFQSTHPRGVRPVRVRAKLYALSCFNPRTRVGCDCFHVLSSRFP